MTAEVKDKIMLAIDKATGGHVLDCFIIDATNQVENIVDDMVAEALNEVCYGKILSSLGLEIKSSRA